MSIQPPEIPFKTPSKPQGDISPISPGTAKQLEPVTDERIFAQLLKKGPPQTSSDVSEFMRRDITAKQKKEKL
jgi:hypothetical protein